MSKTESDDRMLSLHISNASDPVPTLNSASVRFAGTTHRIDFSQPKPLDVSLSDKIASAITPLVHSVLQAENGLIEDPDFHVAGDRVMLGGTRVETPFPGQVVVRFKYLIGPLNGLFRTRVPFENVVLDHRERLAVEVLADIAFPLLNLATVAPGTDPTGRDRQVLEAKLANIGRQASDIQFYLSLLTRYVRDCAGSESHPVTPRNVANDNSQRDRGT